MKPSPTMKTIRSLVKADGRSLRAITKDTTMSHKTLHEWIDHDQRAIVHLESLLGALGYEVLIVKPTNWEKVTR